MSTSSLSSSSVSAVVVGPTPEPEVEDTGITSTEILLAIVIFLIMTGVGMAIDKKLFKKIVTTRQALFAAIQGVCQQYIMMPLIAYLLALIFGVDKYTALGFIMCGCVPGGTTSNAFTTMANGVLELSVFMTVCSTLLGFGFTPLWLFAYGKAVGVDATEMDFGTLGIGFALLLIPLILGAAISFCCPKVKKYVEIVFSILTVIFVIAAIIVVSIENSEALEEADWRTHVPACFFFLISSSIGYFLSANVFKNYPATNRTIFLEVGLQNTTLVYSLVEVTLRLRSQRLKAFVFPLLYTIWMFFWSGIACFLFRKYSEYNKRNDIPDADPNMSNLNNEDDEDKPKDEETQTAVGGDRELEEGGDGSQDKADKYKANEDESNAEEKKATVDDDDEASSDKKEEGEVEASSAPTTENVEEEDKEKKAADEKTPVATPNEPAFEEPAPTSDE